MNSPLLPKLSHFGIYVWDLDTMVKFYTTLFALKVTDRGEAFVFKNTLAFLSADPNAHHQLVLSSGRPRDALFSTVMQMSFKVQDLAMLRAISGSAPTLGATKVRGVNHGNSISVYFADPEGNTVEAYLDTDYYVAQPHADPLDLTKTDEEIMRDTEANCRADASFMPVAEWRKQFSAPSADA
jgi:catechol 2,3-dioxygenase